MGDEGEYWAVEGPRMKEESMRRRARNRKFGAERLAECRVPFDSKNDGAHLIVDNRIDYWPGTGLWIERKSSYTGRGIQSLLNRIEEE